MMAGRRTNRSNGRRTVARLVAVPAALALLLAACGGEEGDTETTAAPEPAAEDEQEPEEVVGEEGEAAPEPTADVCEEHFSGQQIEWVVPYDPGGGFDAYPRLIDGHLEQELDANITILNQPGAGGLLAINNLYNTGTPDGYTIAIMNGGASLGATLAESENVNFEWDDLTVLGLIGGDPNLLVTAPDSEFESFEEMLNSDSTIRFASTGVSSADFISPSVLTAVFDMDTDIITGFDSSVETELAVIRGEVDAMTGGYSSRMPSINAGETVPIAYLAPERRDDLPDVPSVHEFAETEEQREILAADNARASLSRIVVAPPGMDEEIANCLRDALERVLTDSDVIEEMEDAGRPIDWQSADWVRDRINETLDAPDLYRQVLLDSLGD